jgi:hypothetical protein
MTTVDKQIDRMRSEVTREVLDLLPYCHPSDLTTCELIGMLAILRSGIERASDDDGGPGTPVDGSTTAAKLVLLRPSRSEVKSSA